VEYLEKQLMGMYEREAEKARALEDQVKTLKAQLEAVGRRIDFSDVVKRLEAVQNEISRSNKALTGLYESYGSVLNKLGDTINSLNEFAEGFISKAELNTIQETHNREIENLRRSYEARIEALERAEDWRLNPSVIVRMSHIVNELNQLADTGKQTLKIVATMDSSIRFSEDQIALAVARSPSTTRQYLRQLVSLGWIKQVGRDFQNNIDENLTKKLREVQRPGQEPIPDIVIERCKKELQTFIRSL
jgi:DNA repair ATPase RecN